MVLCTYISIRHHRPADFNNKHSSQQPNNGVAKLCTTKYWHFLTTSQTQQ